MDMNENDKKAILADLRKIIEERLTPEQIDTLDDWWLFSEEPQAQLKTFKENVKSISFEFILITILTEVAPLMAEELEKDLVIKEELEKMTDIEELMKSEPFQTILERVEDRLKEKYPNIPEVTTRETHIIAKRLQNIIYPIGKINNRFWTLFEEAQKDGQISIAVEKRGSKKPADIVYSVRFDELQGLSITKKLTAYDKRVYIAIGSLYNSGNEVITASQIYFAMGNTSRPNTKETEKINKAVTKMNLAHIFISNEPERNVYKNRKKFVYDASLLPMERKSGFINNVYADSAIHLFREPPLISFARERGQITTFDKKLLESPVSKTEGNLKIEDYLLDRISQMKRAKGKLSNKIVFNTLYDNCDIKTAKQKQRAIEKVKRYLEHHKECKNIDSYSINKDGIKIYYS